MDSDQKLLNKLLCGIFYVRPGVAIRKICLLSSIELWTLRFCPSCVLFGVVVPPYLTSRSALSELLLVESRRQLRYRSSAPQYEGLALGLFNERVRCIGLSKTKE
jgi:hypothetical protein